MLNCGPYMDQFIESPQENSLARSTLLIDLDSGFSESGIQQRKRARFRRSLSWRVAIRSMSALRRVADVMLALALLLFFSPVWMALLGVAHISGGGIHKRQRLGRWATHFDRYELNFARTPGPSHLTFLRSFPALFNVLKGEMSLIGPRAVASDATIVGERAAWKRYDLRPGLLSLWWLRKRANIAYSSEVDLDVEYVETNTLWGDFGIAMRAVPAAFFGGAVGSAPQELKFLGVRIDNLTMAEASAKIVGLTGAVEPSQICFVNADCVNIAFGDSEYRATLAAARYVLADGIGVRVAGAILDQHIRENINGTDMLPYLCTAAEEAGLSVHLFGGRPGVAEDVAAWMEERYPRLKLVGIRNGYFSDEEQPQVIAQIAAARADILLVALGAPRQEKWIAAHLKELGIKVGIGVGGLFDFYAGRIPRAPIWMRELGMEWLYRFWQEPRRMWRRYFLGNAVFLYRVLRERLRMARNVSHTEDTLL
jgi:N-acetylglucosaminyldiphosphoundecaprenol N-acetyl-beta-D-mannosaminyltransferase